MNVDGEKNIVLSGFAQNVFRVGKEAGVLRDENDFRDLELRDDHDDDEKKKHNSPSERIFTARRVSKLDRTETSSLAPLTAK